MYLSFTYLGKRNATVTYFLKFMGIYILFTSLLNFMCLLPLRLSCVYLAKMPNELWSKGPIFCICNGNVKFHITNGNTSIPKYFFCIDLSLYQNPIFIFSPYSSREIYKPNHCFKHLSVNSRRFTAHRAVAE